MFCVCIWHFIIQRYTYCMVLAVATWWPHWRWPRTNHHSQRCKVLSTIPTSRSAWKTTRHGLTHFRSETQLIGWWNLPKVILLAFCVVEPPASWYLKGQWCDNQVTFAVRLKRYSGWWNTMCYYWNGFPIMHVQHCEITWRLKSELSRLFVQQSHQNNNRGKHQSSSLLADGEGSDGRINQESNKNCE